MVRAIQDGADALACDVRVTSDGHLICHHDPILDRARLRERGHDLHVRTVDTPEEVDACLRAGAVAVITDRPREVLGQIGPGPRAPCGAGPRRPTGV